MTAPVIPSLIGETDQLLARLGVEKKRYSDGAMAARSPVTGEIIARVVETSADEAREAIGQADAAFKAWRNVPAPRRGELIRLFVRDA